MASLREKTDRELIAIIRAALERGFELLRNHTHNGDAAAHRVEAERAHAEAARLLAVVYGLPGGERLRLQGQIEELRAALDIRAGAEVPKVRGAGC